MYRGIEADTNKKDPAIFCGCPVYLALLHPSFSRHVETGLLTIPRFSEIAGPLDAVRLFIALIYEGEIMAMFATHRQPPKTWNN